MVAAERGGGGRERETGAGNTAERGKKEDHGRRTAHGSARGPRKTGRESKEQAVLVVGRLATTDQSRASRRGGSPFERGATSPRGRTQERPFPPLSCPRGKCQRRRRRGGPLRAAAPRLVVHRARTCAIQLTDDPTAAIHGHPPPALSYVSIRGQGGVRDGRRPRARPCPVPAARTQCPHMWMCGCHALWRRPPTEATNHYSTQMVAMISPRTHRPRMSPAGRCPAGATPVASWDGSAGPPPAGKEETCWPVVDPAISGPPPVRSLSSGRASPPARPGRW